MTHVAVPDALLALGEPPSHPQIHPREAIFPLSSRNWFLEEEEEDWRNKGNGG